MSGFPIKHERIKIILANDSELAEESPERIEFYQRYWAIESWDPVKGQIRWAETISRILASLGTTHGKMTTVVQNHPVRVDPIACPDCEGRVHLNLRQSVQQALRGSIPLCNACVTIKIEERNRRRHEAEQEFKVLARKIRKAFAATICDDRRPEECISSLNESAVALYLDMLDRSREDPLIILCGSWALSLGDKYEKSGPDLYALASHRLIKPWRSLGREVVLTRHGLINPSGYPYVSWAVEEELDGWPVIDLMRKQLSLLGDEKVPDNHG